jgi:hypothetical protein
MAEPASSDTFLLALAQISPVKRTRADAARQRYERRQARIARRQRELAAARAKPDNGQVARALAKAQALANGGT